MAKSVDANRADALKLLKTKLGHAFRPPDEPAQLVGISTGCIAVDYVVGNGGFPRAKISEVFGDTSSGKTTLCVTACAKAQAMGFYPVYIDVERGMDRFYAEKIGFSWEDETKGLLVTPDTFEECLIFIEKLALAGADLIMVDSVPAMVPAAVMEGDITEIGALGQSARLFAAALPRLTKVIDKTNTAVVFCNQLRANLEINNRNPYAPKEKAYGGYALKFFSSLRVELRQLKKNAVTTKKPSLVDPEKEEEISVAARHTALAFKNKVSIPYRSIEFYIRFDPDRDLWGIDNLQTILDIAMAKGVIEVKGGGYFTYKSDTDNVSLRGEPALYNWFNERPDEIRHLRTLIGV